MYTHLQDEKHLFHALRIKMCVGAHFNLQCTKYIFHDSTCAYVCKNVRKREIYNSYNNTYKRIEQCQDKKINNPYLPRYSGIIVGHLPLENKIVTQLPVLLGFREID